MMIGARRSLRRWSWVHKWSSIVCTVFMLMLCITGLPLIFHEEIDELLHEEVAAGRRCRPARRRPTSTACSQTAMAQVSGRGAAFPRSGTATIRTCCSSASARRSSPIRSTTVLCAWTRTPATFLDAPDFTRRFTYIMLKLHTDMFAGLPGKLFLGLMGILFCVAIVSGVVVYAPSMRKLAVRRLPRRAAARRALARPAQPGRHPAGGVDVGRRLHRRDQHLGRPGDQDLAVRPARGDDRAVSRRAAADQARRRSMRRCASRASEVPGMEPSFVAFPGTIFSSKSHYAVFLRGDTPLTSRLLRPVLIDAATGEFTETPRACRGTSPRCWSRSRCISATTAACR